MDLCTMNNKRLFVKKKPKQKKQQKKNPPIYLTIMLHYLLHVVNLVLRNIKSILYNYWNFRGQNDDLSRKKNSPSRRRGENCFSRVSKSSCIDRKLVIIVYHIIKLCVLSRVLSSEDILITFILRPVLNTLRNTMIHWTSGIITSGPLATSLT